MSTATLVNINGSDDPHYRYKRSKINISHIRSNRTRINNIVKIGKDLNRKPDEIMKGLSLLCNTQVVDGDCWKGSYSVNTLETKLKQYIKEFVLCDRCVNPETTYLKKKNKLGKGCKACGYSSRIKTNDKLIRYILR